MPVLLFFEYIHWLYSDGIKEYIRVWGNLEWFFYHFFSVPALLATFFQPFKRLQEGYGKGLDVGRWTETFIMNTVMRFVGMVVRSVFLGIAFVAEVAVGIAGAVLFILFVGAPVLIPLGLAMGIFLLLS
jgi:hypothetical protein